MQCKNNNNNNNNETIITLIWNQSLCFILGWLYLEFSFPSPPDVHILSSPLSNWWVSSKNFPYKILYAFLVSFSTARPPYSRILIFRNYKWPAQTKLLWFIRIFPRNLSCVWSNIFWAFSNMCKLHSSFWVSDYISNNDNGY
jgi:hypothetical protein